MLTSCLFFLFRRALGKFVEDIEKERHVKHGKGGFTNHAAHDAGAD